MPAEAAVSPPLVLRLILACGAFALASTLVAAAGSAQEPGPSGGYVQPQIDQAPPGSTIRLLSGLYPENLRITKDLTIIGDGDVYIDGRSGTAITIQGANVRLANMVLWSATRSIDVSNALRLRLEDVEFNSTAPGLARNVAGISTLNKAEAPTPVFELDNSTLYQAHHLTVRILDAEGRPRAALDCAVLDDGAVAGLVRTDPDGELHLAVPFAWRTAADAGTNRTVLRILADEAEHELDAGAGTQIIRPAASQWFVDPVVVVPATTVAAGGLAAALAFRFYDPFRWRWLLLFAPLFSRFAKDELLEHDVRETIYGYIEANPGAHLRGIKRDLSLKHGTLLHHLQMLETHGFVKSARDGMYRRYFKTNAVPRFQGAEELSTLVLRFVRDQPGATNAQIAEALSKRPSLVHYHVERLVEQGRLRKERDASGVHIWPGKDLPPAAS